MNLKKLLVIPPLIIAAVGYAWMTADEADGAAATAVSRQPVRALTILEAPLTVTATGYGRVEPVRSWSAVSQVDGRVVDTFKDLAVGSFVSKGELLVQIDPKDYQLALAKAEANIAAARASLQEIDSQEANTERLLESEQRILSVAQVEFARVEQLVDSGRSTPAALDAAQKTLFNQENAVLSLENTLALFPAQRASGEATLAIREAEMAEAQRRLDNTTIVAPYDGRVAMKAIEEGQYVRTGHELLSLQGTAQAEIVAAFQPKDFADLASASLGHSVEPLGQFDAANVIDRLKGAGVTAHVLVQSPSGDAKIPANLMRFRGTVDEKTGTLGIAVRVDDPLRADRRDARPPLAVNGFVSVVLEADLPVGALSIPRSALRQDDAGHSFVYVATQEDTLAELAVSQGPTEGENVVITSGLSAGMRVILSNPRPAIIGMPLTVIGMGAAR